MSVTQATASALPADLEALMRQLKMPYARARALAPELIATAKSQRWEPAEVIKALFIEEVGQSRSMLATRRKAAGFTTGKTFDTWDKTVSSIPVPTQQTLRTLEWIARKENVVVCGPAGTGKSFFLEALRHQVVEAGMRVAWFRLEDLRTQAAAPKSRVPGVSQAGRASLPSRRRCRRKGGRAALGDGQLRRPQVRERQGVAGRQPRFRVPFKPTHTSWTNLVEVWFGIVERQAIRRGVSTSVKDLNAKIRAFIDGWNDRSHPFVWTKTADEALAKANRKKTSKCGPLGAQT